jgi:tellurite resistance protein
MKINYNVTGEQRKALVAAISKELNAPTKYLGAPTFGYEVGDPSRAGSYTITKTGEVIGEDNVELVATLDLLHGFKAVKEEPAEPTKRKGIMDTLVEALNENAEDGEHWERLHTPPTIIDERGREHNLDGTFASAAAAEKPDTITIELPSINVKEDILRALIESKATIIKTALGEDGTGELPIEFDKLQGKVRFEWLKYGTDSDTIQAWSAFLAAACKFAKTAKRVTAKDGEVENEKFAMRTFMVKLGMKGEQDKAWRRVLMRNLKGDAAFATVESKERWLLKHGNKKNAEEGSDNE